MTPYQRVIESSHIDNKTKKSLQAKAKELDPFLLRKQIEAKLKKIFELVDTKDLHTRVAI